MATQSNLSMASPPPFPHTLCPYVPGGEPLIRTRETWYKTARATQIWPAGEWRYWLILAGRGWGKTKTGAENVIDYSIEHPGCRIHVVAPTFGDVSGTCFQGESGLLASLPDSCAAGYNKSLAELTMPNGALIKGFSADQPNRLRGPQCHFAWCDEPAAFRYPESWTMLMLGLRLGSDPRCIATTTPKPVKLVRDLIKDPNTRVTRGTSYENRDNLAPAFFEKIIKQYEGTRLGRQELNAEVLDDVPGALWQRAQIDALRVAVAPDMYRVVVAIDPAVSANEDSDETGIIVAGLGVDGHGYVLADLTCRLSPDGWARRAVTGYRQWRADRIVAEVNNGGDMVRTTVATVDPRVPYKAVHASRGKIVRAEPIAALTEQGRIHHVGTFDELEDQQCSFTPDNLAGTSPDRVDAYVWAMTELFLEIEEREERVIYDEPVSISAY